MLTTILAASLLAQGGAPQVNAPELVGKMLAYYNDAKTLTGTIVLTVRAGEQGGTLTTNVQFEQPSKLYIRQQKSTAPKVWLVVSNGKTFAYDSPGLNSADEGKRLIEPVKVGSVSQTIRDIYAAASAGLGDRSAPLDIAIGRLEDLKFLRSQWKSVHYKGTAEYEGEQLHVVFGDWRPYGNAELEGQYRMYITGAGELKQFARFQTVRPAGSSQAIQVLQTWDVNLVKNGKPIASLFSNVR